MHTLAINSGQIHVKLLLSCVGGIHADIQLLDDFDFKTPNVKKYVFWLKIVIIIKFTPRSKFLMTKVFCLFHLCFKNLLKMKVPFIPVTQNINLSTMPMLPNFPSQRQPCFGDIIYKYSSWVPMLSTFCPGVSSVTALDHQTFDLLAYYVPLKLWTRSYLSLPDNAHIV